MVLIAKDHPSDFVATEYGNIVALSVDECQPVTTTVDAVGCDKERLWYIVTAF